MINEDALKFLVQDAGGREPLQVALTSDQVSYVPPNYRRVVPETIDFPDSFLSESLSSIWEMFGESDTSEQKHVFMPTANEDSLTIFIESPYRVIVTVDHEYFNSPRQTLLSVNSPRHPQQKWRSFSEFIIHVNRNFHPTEARDQLLKAISLVRAESSVSVVDDGISQSVTVENEGKRFKVNGLKNPLLLEEKPPFPDITTAPREFYLRINDSDECCLFEVQLEEWEAEMVSEIKGRLRSQSGMPRVIG